MAGTAGKSATVIDRFTRILAQKPYEFEFFSVLRHFECLYPERPRLGESLQPIEDPVRIGQKPAVTFESASLAEFEAAAEHQPHRLTVRCFGLWGGNGPMPLHLTEYARQRLKRHNDPTFLRFADIFHHRMLSLFYRAWANNEPTVSFDRPHDDRFGDYTGAVAGVGMSTLRKRDEIDDLTKLYYCGRLGSQTKSAEGLQDLLLDYFQLPVRIKSFVGEWLPLPTRSVCRLGIDPKNGTLGQSVMLGKRVWGCQHKFRIVMGPLTLEQYESLLPVGGRIRRLIALVRNYIGDELAWDLKLILKRKAVPAASLSNRSRLGWTTWLGSKSQTDDADDLVVDAFAFITRESHYAEGFK